jgi:hypothetical protein
MGDRQRRPATADRYADVRARATHHIDHDHVHLHVDDDEHHDDDEYEHDLDDAPGRAVDR